MTRSDQETVFFYSFAGYMLVSMLGTVLLLLGALAGMKLLFAAARLMLGAEAAYAHKTLFYDSSGFALASAGTAVLHYYLVSLLLYSGLHRRRLGAGAGVAAVFCGLFFWRGALHSSLGSYAFSGLCVTLCALIGGAAALTQRPGENPWPFTAAAIFR